MGNPAQRRNAKRMLKSVSRLSLGMVSESKLRQEGFTEDDVAYIQRLSGLLKEDFLEGCIVQMEVMIEQAFEQMHGKMRELKPNEIPKAMETLLKFWAQYREIKQAELGNGAIPIGASSSEDGVVEMSPDQVVAALGDD